MKIGRIVTSVQTAAKTKVDQGRVETLQLLSIGNLIAIDKGLIKGSKFVKGEPSGAKEQSSNFSPSEILFILDITKEQWNHRMEIKVQELTGKNVRQELKDEH